METTNNREIVVLQSAAEVAQEAARRFVSQATSSIAANGRFSVALSGGNTPRVLYGLLAGPPYVSQLDWQHIFIFFGDERCVPPDHPDSNYRMAQESFLSKVAIPQDNVYRMRGEADPAVAAEEYTTVLQKFFGLSHVGGPSPENYPRLDLILLGMGPDGHTASLFPGTAALQERSKPVTVNYVPKLDANRLTLTAPALNRAVQILFVVEGDSKAQPLHEVLEGEYQPQVYPSQLVRPTQGRLTFLVDQQAAAQLKKSS